MSPFPSLFPAKALADGELGRNVCLLYRSAVFQQWRRHASSGRRSPLSSGR
ncbi:MAG: hypothetical protein ACRDJ4_05000 [Actinomycetota bacterium]